MGYSIILGFLVMVILLFTMIALFYSNFEHGYQSVLDAHRTKQAAEQSKTEHNKIEITSLSLHNDSSCRNFTLEITAINKGAEVIDLRKLEVMDNGVFYPHELTGGWNPMKSIKFNLTFLNATMGVNRTLKLITDAGGTASKDYTCYGNCPTNATFSSWSYNSTAAGSDINLSVTINDPDKIWGFQFSIDNGTGNYSYDQFNHSPALQFQTYNFSTVRRVNSTVGSLIRFQLSTNDTCGNLSVTQGSLVTTKNCWSTMTFGDWSNSGTFIDTDVEFSILISDPDNISGYEFWFDNGVGEFENDSFTEISGNQSNWAFSVVKHTTSQIGKEVRYYIVSNDSCGYSNTSSIGNFTTNSAVCPNNPVFWSWAYNSTEAGSLVNLTLNARDDDTIKGYQFYYDNGTGTFIPDSYVDLGAGSETLNFSVAKVINTTQGATIRFRLAVNDSCGAFINSSTGNFTVTGQSPCTTIASFSSWAYNATNSSRWANISINVSDSDNVTGYQFHFDNGTGSYVPDPYSANAPGLAYLNFSTARFLNTTVNSTIRFILTANDTCGNLVNSSAGMFNTTCGYQINYSSWAFNSTTAGSWVNMSVNATDLDGIWRYFFSFKNGTSASWVNDPTVFPSGNPTQLEFSAAKFVNTTVGTTIYTRLYVYDVCGHMVRSDGSFVTTAP